MSMQFNLFFLKVVLAEGNKVRLEVQFKLTFSSMSLLQKQVHKIKQIDTRTKYLIKGYLQSIEQLFPDDNYYKTPDLILMTCLLYYYIFTDKWDTEQIDSQSEIIGDTLYVSNKPGTNDQNAFLSNIITITVGCFYQWKFKFIEFEKYWTHNPIIGIKDISGDTQSSGIWTARNENKYALCLSREQLIVPGNKSWQGIDAECTDYPYSTEFKEGDVLEMYLKENTLGFKLNNKDLGIKQKVKESSKYIACVYTLATTNKRVVIKLLDNHVS